MMRRPAAWAGSAALTLALALVLAAAGHPGVARAQLDPADTISLSAPSGPAYADYPFTFTGAGTVDGGDAGSYGVEVLFTPSASRILRGGCPADFNATAQAIEQAYGGPDVIALYSQLGLTTPVLLYQGAYTWAAQVNGESSRPSPPRAATSPAPISAMSSAARRSRPLPRCGSRCSTRPAPAGPQPASAARMTPPTTA
jgi:hypothetical protein